MGNRNTLLFSLQELKKEAKADYKNSILYHAGANAQYLIGTISGINLAINIIKGFDKESRIGFMDQVDFDYELGYAAGGNTIYPSLQDLISNNKEHIKECGAVRVRVYKEKVVKKGKI